MPTSRRDLLVAGAGLTAAHALAGRARSQEPRPAAAGEPGDPDSALFKISLAQWSLHRMLRAGELDPLDFPGFARETFDIEAVEYVSTFFADQATDFQWLGELKENARAAGVRSLLIMIDGEGELADPDDARRRRAIENHFKWIAAAAFLGCHSIRVNAGGSGPWEDQRDRAAESLRRLGEFGASYGVNVIVENHGGLSSNGEWLAAVMKAADHPRVGTLPDFGNFDMGGGKWYDRYKGVRELMPWAKGVSAKSYGFDENGDEIKTDYRRMMEIVVVAGYRGYVGIEYEGDEPSEVEGVRMTKALLERVLGELSGKGR